MARDRGIEDIESRNGNLLELVSQTIQKKNRVRILEAGCGHGVAMMGLIKRFGASVEVIGFNLNRRHGTVSLMKSQAVKKGLFTATELKDIKLPQIVYCDASSKLPFPSNYFDFIYSQSAVYLFDDKINFFQECNRILTVGGIARLSPGFGSLPAPKGNRGNPTGIEIWDNGAIVSARGYIGKLPGVSIVNAPTGVHYLQITKTKKLNFKLRFVTAIDYNYIWSEWAGVKSIYTTQLDFRPHWK